MALTAELIAEATADPEWGSYNTLTAKVQSSASTGDYLVLFAGGGIELDQLIEASIDSQVLTHFWRAPAGTWMNPHFCCQYVQLDHDVDENSNLICKWNQAGPGMAVQLLRVVGAEPSDIPMLATQGAPNGVPHNTDPEWQTNIYDNVEPGVTLITGCLTCTVGAGQPDNTPRGTAIHSNETGDSTDGHTLGFGLHTQYRELGEESEDGTTTGGGEFSEPTDYQAGAIAFGTPTPVTPYAPTDDPVPDLPDGVIEVGSTTKKDGMWQTVTLEFTRLIPPGEVVALGIWGNSVQSEPMEITGHDEHVWDCPDVYKGGSDPVNETYNSGGWAYCYTGERQIDTGDEITIKFQRDQNQVAVQAFWLPSAEENHRLVVADSVATADANGTVDWETKPTNISKGGWLLSNIGSFSTAREQAPRSLMEGIATPVSYLRTGDENVQAPPFSALMQTNISKEGPGKPTHKASFEGGSSIPFQTFSLGLNDFETFRANDPDPDPPVWLIDAGSNVQDGSGITGASIEINQDIPMGSFLVLCFAVGYGTADSSISLSDATGNFWNLNQKNFSTKNEPWCGMVYSQNKAAPWSAGDRLELRFLGADLKTHVACQLALVKGAVDWRPSEYEGRAAPKYGDKLTPTMEWETNPHDFTGEVGGIVSFVVLNGEILQEPPASNPAQGGVLSRLRAGMGGTMNPPFQTLLQVQGSQVVKGAGTQVTGAFIGSPGYFWTSAAEYFVAEAIPPPPPGKGNSEAIGNPKRKHIKQPGVPTIGTR